MMEFSKVTCAMERHEWSCQPGQWLVVLCVSQFLERSCYNAVVDDFGNLVRVS